ncbi:cobalamin B12-binding domain-containing protein [Desulfothermus okinawensis JCM 13304]
MAKRKLRIMVAKPGLDGHDRGARILARFFRDSGYEVIYTGCHQTPEQIVEAAIQEDVDLIGLSCLSGAHKKLFPEVVDLLKEKGADDIVVIGGGIIPEQDFQYLYDHGIKAVFTPGTPLEDIKKWIDENVKVKEDLL